MNKIMPGVALMTLLSGGIMTIASSLNKEKGKRVDSNTPTTLINKEEQSSEEIDPYQNPKL